VLEALPEDDEAEEDDEPEEDLPEEPEAPPLSACAGAQASARSRLAVVVTKAVRNVFMAWFLKKSVDRSFACDFFPQASQLYAGNFPTAIYFV
jgi:hypothetical protein